MQNFPKKVEGFIAGEIFINRQNLTRQEQLSLLNLATFSNPEYIKRQRMRMPVWDVPSILTAAKIDGKYLRLPRGVESSLKDNCHSYLKEQFTLSKALNVEFTGTLRPQQEEAVNKIDKNKLGMLCAHTGFGKTVFMNSVGKQIDQDPTWITIHLIIGDNMVGRLAEMIYQQSTNKIKKVFNQLSDINFEIGGLGLKFTLNDKQTSNYQLVLKKMLKILDKNNQKVLVMIDEAQEVTGMVELASVYQVMISEGLPISIIMTGLPKNVQELQNNHVLTFLLRSGRISPSPLNYYDIRAQYQQALKVRDPEISPEVVRRAALLSDGYAYAFQLLGYLLWESPDKHITMKTIDSIQPEYQAQLSRNAYSKMLEELSIMDQQFVITMAKASEYPVSTSCLRTKLKKKPGYIGMYRRRLIDSQLITPAGYGKLKFTLPLFKQFLLDDGQYLVNYS